MNVVVVVLKVPLEKKVTNIYLYYFQLKKTKLKYNKTFYTSYISKMPLEKFF